MWSPQLLPRRRQRSMTFEALSHGFGHHCLRFVPSSWTTTQNSFPVVDQPSGWAFPCPLSSFGEFHTFALPSPRASLGAKQFSSWQVSLFSVAQTAQSAVSQDAILQRPVRARRTLCRLAIGDTADWAVCATHTETPDTQWQIAEMRIAAQCEPLLAHAAGPGRMPEKCRELGAAQPGTAATEACLNRSRPRTRGWRTRTRENPRGLRAVWTIAVQRTPHSKRPFQGHLAVRPALTANIRALA
jgi:hypothetical protein